MGHRAGSQLKYNSILSNFESPTLDTGCPKKSHFRNPQTLGTLYSETANLLAEKHGVIIIGVFRGTPCCQIPRPNRLVVSEYKASKVFVFLGHPVDIFIV